jgi:sulfur relay (sulfurtransferase) complex TusBCD TusD component (DsrE family)
MTKDGVGSLGILLTRSAGTADAMRALGMAGAAARRGLEVEVFLMTDGVDLLRTGEVAALLQAGVRVRVCTHSATERGAPLDVPGVDYASQVRLGRTVAGVDRFVSFS